MKVNFSDSKKDKIQGEAKGKPCQVGWRRSLVMGGQDLRGRGRTSGPRDAVPPGETDSG